MLLRIMMPSFPNYDKQIINRAGYVFWGSKVAHCAKYVLTNNDFYGWYYE